MIGTDREQMHQEDLRRIQRLRLIDDDFMNVCFDDNIEATELLLRVILGGAGGAEELTGPGHLV